MKKNYLTLTIAPSLMLLTLSAYAASNGNQGNIETITLKNNTSYTMVYTGQQLDAPQEQILLNITRIPPGGQTIITGISLNYGRMPFKQVMGTLNFNAINNQGRLISQNTFMISDQPEAHSQAPVNQFMRSNQPTKGQLISKMVANKWDPQSSPFALQRIQATMDISAVV